LAQPNPSFVNPGWMARASAACGLLGLLALFLLGEI
jgi:hypothetical protein